jgi:predicted kinase
VRNLLLLVGTQLQGKSSWVAENNLIDFTLSLDSIRLMFSHPTSTINGRTTINGRKNAEVINMFNRALESRMFEGAFTVVDAMHNMERDFSKYRKLCEKYGYRLYVKDFRKRVDLEEVKLRNNIRKLNYIPTENLIKVYENQYTGPIKGATYISSIKDVSFVDGIRYYDANRYKSVFYIGDIHGCIDALNEFIAKHYTEDSLYVFTGDYIDRGPNSSEVVKVLNNLYNNGNVELLEGNHERWLRFWANGNDEAINNKDFKESTVPQLEYMDPVTHHVNLTKKEGRSFCNKLTILSAINFRGNAIFSSHGGVNRIKDCHPAYKSFSADHYIKGVGDYRDLDEMYKLRPEDADFIIHGHRNLNDKFVTGPYFNLEGGVEGGGKLRVIEFTEEGVQPHFIQSQFNRHLLGDSVVKRFRNSELVKETVLEPHLSSFNFSRVAFTSKSWNDIVVRARGIFINTLDNSVMARSYNKFYNINEMPETSLDAIRNLSYPIIAYEKANGYLGIVSWDRVENKLLVASKSTTKGDHAMWLRNLLEDITDIPKLSRYLIENNVSAVFEVILPEEDPHIIEYDAKELILLDLIPNSYQFSTLDENERFEFIDKIYVGKEGLRSKQKLGMYSDFESLMSDLKVGGFNNIEGLVFTDSNGFSFKYKSPYYNALKCFRGHLEKLRNGSEPEKSKLISKLITLSALDTDDKVHSGWDKQGALRFADYLSEHYSESNSIIKQYNNFKSNA